MSEFHIICADVLDGLRSLPDASVHCCVTSPPYWGLRDYGTAQWEGGDTECDHTATRRNHGDEKQSTSAGTSRDRIQGEDCRKCGARRIDQQIGLEPTPEAYVARLVEVFREVRRVLRDDGTLWLNMGDSYGRNPAKGASGTFNGRNGYGENYPNKGNGASEGARLVFGLEASARAESQSSYKEKDLIGVPWRVAFALQADGWWLRSDIIWAKPNPMPESVRDRPTKAHEYLFLLAKSKRYYYDATRLRRQPIQTTTEQIHLFGQSLQGRSGKAVWILSAEKSFVTKETSVPSGPSPPKPSLKPTSPPSQRR